MSKNCELTGKTVATGNNVSHANNKTRRRFLPNLHKTSFFSAALQSMLSLRVSTRALRSVDKKGGIDEFLISSSDSALSTRAVRYKKMIEANGSRDTEAASN